MSSKAWRRRSWSTSFIKRHLIITNKKGNQCYPSLTVIKNVYNVQEYLWKLLFLLMEPLNVVTHLLKAYNSKGSTWSKILSVTYLNRQCVEKPPTQNGWVKAIGSIGRSWTKILTDLGLTSNCSKAWLLALTVKLFPSVERHSAQDNAIQEAKQTTKKQNLKTTKDDVLNEEMAEKQRAIGAGVGPRPTGCWDHYPWTSQNWKER